VSKPEEDQESPSLGNRDGAVLWPGFSLDRSGGVPCVFHKGGRAFFWAANRPVLDNEVRVYHRLHASGLRVAHVDANATADIYHPHLNFWVGPGKYDPAPQEHYFRKVAEASPDSFFVLRVALYAPEWWTQAHLGELQLDGGGSEWFDLQRAGRIRLPSLASRSWRDGVLSALSAYLSWLETSGWSRRVAGFLLSAGITWEWSILGSDVFPDTSEPAREYFREYLRRVYGSEDALSQAWGRQSAWDEIEIPTVERRRMSIDGIRPAPEFQDAIDHQQSLSEMTVDLLLDCCQKVRTRTLGRSLIGAFYGYTLTAREQTPFTGQYGAGGLVGGHHALGRVLRSPDIDFLASPFNYADRALGSGLLMEHVPLGSVQAHGKAFFDENDLWMKPPVGDDRAAAISVGVAANPAEAKQYLHAAWAQAAVRGKHQWLTELSGWVGEFCENFDDPALLSEIRRLNALTDELVLLDRSPVAEIAFVIDEKSVAHLGLDSKVFLRDVYEASVRWGHLGAPFDILLLEDALALSSATSRYKVLVEAFVRPPFARSALRAHAETLPNVRFLSLEESCDSGQLRCALEVAGAHLYAPVGHTVWANRSMVMIHAASGGTLPLHLPSTGRWQEVLTGSVVEHPEGQALGWSLRAGDTALFTKS